ncbi:MULTISPECIES: APC family permease [unclassified Acinetobacter]|uniref:APC family permease n=1 Tax=unclassified Acinetobacter TaxID=196816 RepID=UPI0029349968|nr:MULTISPECIES: APC family permease [unclassified Acinetobacter]WOE32417.1 APC family permease [Acinetobacter sp. SAAs470]WOE37891.1 APC family permease [Acinetobacter sp. SAAs474]
MTNNNALKQGSLGLFTVVFFVVAAASPLTGVIGALPVTFFIGNGVGVPSIFILAGILLLLFSFGFVTMAKYVVNAGAFYAYIVQGIGVRCGLGGLNAALLAYIAIQLAVSAMFGFFTNQFIQSHWNIEIPWWIYSILMQMLVVVLGILKVEIGGKVLGILLLLEIGIVLLLDFVSVNNAAQYSFASFAPSVFLSGNIGISLVFAICSFIGFEATAIYSEECKDPQKTVARATFIAVCLITVFYAVTSWSLIQYVGQSKLVEVAAADPGMMIYNIAQQSLGPWSIELMSLLLITSLFAATQAFHNSLSRYLFTMSRDGLIWSKMANTHANNNTPYIASIIQGIFIIVILALTGLKNLDPMVDVFAWGSVIASMSILVLQIGVSVAVMIFFRKNSHLPVSLWNGTIAPFLALIGMSCVLVLVVQNIKTLSGSESPVIQLVPWFVFAVVFVGIFWAQMIQMVQPQKFKQLKKLIEYI